MGTVGYSRGKGMNGEFFNGFSWAVPKAFSDAVMACRFEEGDILYDTKKAYDGEWGEAEKHIKHSLQVRSPARGPATAVNALGSMFGRNWNTEVTFALEESANDESTKLVQTTQGKLYTALWRGDLSVFDNDSNPDIPLQLMQVLKMLEEAVPAAKAFVGEQPTFIMARDAANRMSKLKHLNVSTALHSHFKAGCEVMTPRDAGLSASEMIAPTIDIAFYVMGQGTKDEIHDVLKEQLYVPAKDAKTEMFRLTRHGLLVSGR